MRPGKHRADVDSGAGDDGLSDSYPPYSGRKRRRDMQPRSVTVLAVLFLGSSALAGIAGLAYQAVINQSESAVNTLGLIATGAIGALAGLLSSAKAGDQNHNGSSDNGSASSGSDQDGGHGG